MHSTINTDAEKLEDLLQNNHDLIYVKNKTKLLKISCLSF